MRACHFWRQHRRRPLHRPGGCRQPVGQALPGPFDEAGLQTFSAYDFKGNVLDKARQVIADAQLMHVFDGPPPNWQVPPLQLDWQPPQGISLAQYADQLLDATLYQTTLAYDALDRAKLLRYPQDVDGDRKELRPWYNRAGALERVELDGATYVNWIAYNAKGQRTLIAYGNGIMTRQAYDPYTFRLARLRTESFTTPTALSFHPAGGTLQDFAYMYDLAGNILGIQERTPGCGVRNNPDAGQESDAGLAQLLVAGDALVRSFTYDPLYRLLTATGRECSDIPSPRPWTDDPPLWLRLRATGYSESRQCASADNALSRRVCLRPCGQYAEHGAPQRLVWMYGPAPSAWAVWLRSSGIRSGQRTLVLQVSGRTHLATT